MLCNRFAVFNKTFNANVQDIERCFLAMYNVYVSVYERKENGRFLCIGCCEEHKKTEMESRMDIDMFNIVDSFMTRMHHNTKLSIELSGCYINASNELEKHSLV